MTARADVPTWIRTLAIVAIVLGVFFRFYHLDHKIFWEDELFGTVHMMGYAESDIVARSASFTNVGAVQAYFHLPQPGSGVGDSLAGTVTSLADEDAQHPPLYYLLGHLWAECFGSSVTAIRALSAVVSVFAIPAAFWLGIELFGSRRVAWILTAFVSLSPFNVLYAQEAREYALWTVLLLLMSAAFLRACRRPTVSSWLLYATIFTIGMYVYPLTLLVAAAFGAFVIATPELRSTTVVRGYAVASIAGVALFAPWGRFIVADLIETGGTPRGMASILRSHLSVKEIALTFLRNVRQVYLDFGRFSIGHVSSTLLNATLAVGIAALAAYGFSYLSKSNPRAARFVALGFALTAIPLVAHDAISGGKLVYQSRYFIPAYIDVQLAIAALFAARAFAGRARFAWATALVLLIGAQALSCTISARAETWWNKDYEVSRDVAAVVNATKNTVVVSEIGTSRTLGLSYYLDPTVALRLHLTCETCRLPPTPPPHDRLADTGRFGTVFLLGPARGADGSDGATSTNDARIRYIDVSVYSPKPSPLGMFLSI